jgi:hypothetical protein
MVFVWWDCPAFYVNPVKKEEWLQKRWLYGLLYGPGLLFLYRAWTGVLTAKDFVQTPLGWVEVGAAESVWLWLHTFNYSACVLIGCVLVFQWGKQSKILREKKQARIIVGTMLTSFILGTIVNILLPASKWQTMPAFAPILILVWAYGIWQAMTHYWFMGLSPAMAQEEALDLFIPSPYLCTDNAAMIAWVGNYYLERGQADSLQIDARSRWTVGEP